MSAASIIITQSGVAAAAGISRDDIALGLPVTLRNSDNTGVRSWRWRMRDRPTSSTATLTSPTNSTTSFTPDVAGTYLVELIVDDGRTGQISTVIAAVREDLNGEDVRWPAAGEEAEANWGGNARGYWPDLELLIRAAAAGGGSGQTVYENDLTALVNNTFVDGAETLGDREWTVGGAAAASVFAAQEGTGIRWVVAPSTAGTFSSTTQTASRLFIPLSTLLGAEWDPAARYSFEFYCPSLTLEQSGDSVYFGLWGAIGTPGVRAVGPRNQVGTIVANTLAQTTTSQGTEDFTAAGYNVYGLVVEPDGVTSLMAGVWDDGWPTLTTARIVTTASSAGDPLYRGDTRLVISFNHASDASPTSAVTIARMRVRRL